MAADALTLNLVGSAALVAIVHTAIGPDHTLPFVMLARARRWSLRRTLLVTAACGAGHVASSLALGALGVAAGASTQALEGLEISRGALAAWGMVVFGAAYALWGIRQALRRSHAIELHAHGDAVHVHAHAGHVHAHAGHGHAHVLGLRAQEHAGSAGAPQHSATFWTLFLVFVLGPCEPLIPLFFLPASEGRWALAAWTGAVFSLVTIATMLVLVGGACAGMRLLPLERLERWSHGLAGLVIAGSGLAVLYGGL